MSRGILLGKEEGYFLSFMLLQLQAKVDKNFVRHTSFGTIVLGWVES